MDEKRSTIGGVAWPSMLIILVGLYGYWTRTRDLDSARPQHAAQGDVPPPVPREGVHALHARLWEDPLSMAWKDAGSPLPGDSVSTEAQSSIEQFLSFLRAHPEANTILGPGIETARTKLGLHSLILPVLVPGGSSGEDKEQRMRIRYAVVSALSEAGFALSYPDRLSYVTLDNVTIEPVPGNARHDVPFVIPVKLYRHDPLNVTVPATIDDREFQIYVLWINESKLGLKPLSVLQEIIERTSGPNGDKPRYHVHVIGPTSSDTLIDIAGEVNKADRDPSGELQENADGTIRTKPGNAPAMRIFSPRATIGGRLALSDEDRRRLSPQHRLLLQQIWQLENHPRTAFLSESTDDAQGSDDGFQFIRVIGNDAQLVELLKDELILREAWPMRHDAGEIVLITESDTSYGRDIGNLFDVELANMADPHRHEDHEHTWHWHEESTTEQHAPHVHIIRYLRGIDGLTVRQGASGARSPPRESDDYDPRRDPLQDRAESITLYRPEGQSQIDYLLRLRDTLREIAAGRLHPDTNGHITPGIVAIGVVGTDVYDKLLILRALRSEFPQAVFFTTDLDAQLLHPAEYASTRNMIVASHFGLRLDPELQTTPPFRDSYQTSTYLAVRLAVQDLKIHSVHRRDPWGLTRSRVSTLARQPQEFDVLAAVARRWREILLGVAVAVLFGFFVIEAPVLLRTSRRASRFFSSWNRRMASARFGRHFQVPSLENTRRRAAFRASRWMGGVSLISACLAAAIVGYDEYATGDVRFRVVEGSSFDQPITSAEIALRPLLFEVGHRAEVPLATDSRYTKPRYVEVDLIAESGSPWRWRAILLQRVLDERWPDIGFAALLSVLLGVLLSRIETFRDWCVTQCDRMARCRNEVHRSLCTWEPYSRCDTWCEIHLHRIVRQTRDRVKRQWQRLPEIVRDASTWLTKNVTELTKAVNPPWHTIALVTTFGVFTATVTVAYDEFASLFRNNEPLNFRDGVSIWPGTLVRLSAIFVSSCYLSHFLNGAIDSYRQRSSITSQRGIDPKYLKERSRLRKDDPTLEAIRPWPEFVRGLGSGAIALLIVVICWVVHSQSGFRDFTPHSIRGSLARVISWCIHVVAVVSALWVIVAVIAEFDECRRCIAKIPRSLRERGPFLPYGAVRYIAERTRDLRKGIGWVVTLVVLLSVPYHPRLEYSPFPWLPLAMGLAAGGALLLWSYLIRRRAKDARETAIRELLEEKRSMRQVDVEFLPPDDPWLKAVEISRRRHGLALATEPEVTTEVATKVECDLIDNEIELIRQIDEGAYSPWYSTPAFAWLSGSAGAWAVLDVLLRTAQSGF